MARRRANVFSLSFLDVMSCGFGAVVLVYLIINHSTQREAETVNKSVLAEIRMLDYQVQNGERDLFALQQDLEQTKQRLDESDQQVTSNTTTLVQQKTEFDELDKDSTSATETLATLQADVESRQKELERLQAIKDANDGSTIRAVTGEGDRQYLTGLKVGGTHILIAVDTSASMLDDTIVNVLRRRNMSEERQRLAPKWQRAVRTVEWLTAQLPLDAQFQVYGFNTEVNSLIPDSDDVWTAVDSGRSIDSAMDQIGQLIPTKGTSLENLMIKIQEMSPLPDNVYLITDSLPTQGTKPARKATISGKDRLDLYRDALRQLPKQVPMNVIMFPMEGDPNSAAAFWHLARTTGGSYLSPSRDWP